jgi:phosphomannomutase
MNPIGDQIFKAYDIRGRYPEQINEEAAHSIGWGFGKTGLIKAGRPVVLGRDMRDSSVPLFESICEGLNAAGISAIDIGRCTTPMLYYAVNTLGAGGGVMITASHNPAGYNGFKFVRERAIPISAESGLREIQREAARAPRIAKGKNNLTSEDITSGYLDFFARRFSIQLDRLAVIDAGNGMAGLILPAVLDAQNILHQDMYFEPDGSFPNHEANPLVQENLEDLQAELLRHPGSIGVAFDGDGDRVGFLDEDGRLVPGDLLTALLARRLLQQQGPGTVLYDLRSSRVVPEVVRASGGRPIKTRVGHSFIKGLMRKENALFAGELSCHFYFRDFFYCESGILAMLRLFELLSESGENLSSLVGPLRRYARSGEVNFTVADQEKAMNRVQERFSAGDVSRLDGLSVDFEDWWFNLRPSNTEPLLRLNLEADTEQLMRERLTEIEGLLKG